MPIAQGYDKAADGSWIEDSGFVVRLLSDDDDDSRHQRFVVQLPGPRTLLVANNLDISSRVPVGMGDRVRFRGLFEWNDRGGLVHWTHHDPRGELEGGWIRYRGEVYS